MKASKNVNVNEGSAEKRSRYTENLLEIKMSLWALQHLSAVN